MERSLDELMNQCSTNLQRKSTSWLTVIYIICIMSQNLNGTAVTWSAQTVIFSYPLTLSWLLLLGRTSQGSPFSVVPSSLDPSCVPAVSGDLVYRSAIWRPGPAATLPPLSAQTGLALRRCAGLLSLSSQRERSLLSRRCPSSQPSSQATFKKT